MRKRYKILLGGYIAINIAKDVFIYKLLKSIYKTSNNKLSDKEDSDSNTTDNIVVLNEDTKDEEIELIDIDTIIDFNKTEFNGEETKYIISNNLQYKLKVGDIITLYNKYCNEFVVIGKNHDFTIGTIDIMPIRPVNNMEFGFKYKTVDNRIEYNNDYETSNVREWINREFISSFIDNDIKNSFKTMVVRYYDGIQLRNLKDKAKLLSFHELNPIEVNLYPAFTLHYITKLEGNPYSKYFGTFDPNIYSYFWLRSKNFENVSGDNKSYTTTYMVKYSSVDNNFIEIVYDKPNTTNDTDDNDKSVLPVLRL